MEGTLYTHTQCALPITHLPATLCRGAGFAASTIGLLLLAATTKSLHAARNMADTHTCIVIKIGRDVDAFNGTLRPGLLTRDACAAQGVRRCV